MHNLLILGLAMAALAAAQNVGIGITTPASRLSVAGNLSIGATYAATAAPPNGAIIEGSVGIGTTSPHPGARLHVTGTGSQGVLLPQVALTSATSWPPVAGTATDGMLVYNTATAGSGVNAVSPGYYYWRQNRWRRFYENAYAGAIFGTLSTTSNSLTTIFPNWQYMNAYIDLPPGRWIVFITQLIYCPGGGSGGIPDGQSLWIRSTFSETEPVWGGVSPDIVGSYLASGAYVGPARFSLVTGQVIIYNQSAGIKRYYYYAHREGYNCSPTNIGTTLWDENQLFALPGE